MGEFQPGSGRILCPSNHKNFYILDDSDLWGIIPDPLIVSSAEMGGLDLIKQIIATFGSSGG